MGETENRTGHTPEKSRDGLPLLQFAAFFSSFDRFVVAPMLVTIAAALGASLARVAATASLYYLLYGVMQPVWGMLSDRLGRVRVMRRTHFGATVAGVLSALAPNLAVLVAARALAGGSCLLEPAYGRSDSCQSPRGGRVPSLAEVPGPGHSRGWGEGIDASVEERSAVADSDLR